MLAEDDAAQLERREFDSTDIVTVLAEGGHDPVQFQAVLHTLEANGYILRGQTGGVDAPFTTFTLTPRGYAAGNPEAHAGGLRPTVRAVGKKASLWVLGALGVTGGPLAFAGLVQPAVDWHGTAGWLVGFWWEKATMPVLDATYRGLAALGVHSVTPHFLESLVEYCTIGLLITAAAWNAASIEREYLYHQVERPRLTWGARAVRVVVLGALGVLLWPVWLLWEFAYTAFAFYVFRFRGDEVGPETRLSLSPQSLLARAIAYFVPVTAFLLLFLVNWLQR